MREQFLKHPTTKRVWYVLSAWFEHYRRSPSYREIAIEAGVSLGTVDRHIWKLREAGVIDRDPGQHRGITLYRVSPEFEAFQARGRARARELGEHVRVDSLPVRRRFGDR